MIKRRGGFEKTNIDFLSEKKLLWFCKLIVIRNGGKLNENHCHDRVDDPLKKLRISATIPPRSVNGPTISIRKHQQKGMTLEELKAIGMLSDWQLKQIRKIVIEGKNIMICGRGGAGKTTLLRAILDDLSSERRFLICESETELYPENKNFLVERIIKREHGASTTLASLVRDGLSVSLDGYCIGEIVGEEAWEFMKASMTDHVTYATIHANGIRDIIPRMKMLINQKVMNYSSGEIEDLIVRSLGYVIYLSGFKVKEIGMYSYEELTVLAEGKEDRYE
jgi:pilus assembly protein CpaF